MNFFTGNTPVGQAQVRDYLEAAEVVLQSRSQIRQALDDLLDYQTRIMARMEAEEKQRMTRDTAAYAGFLDQLRPGWAERVNLSKLDIHSPSNCILGQVFAPRGLRWTGMGWSRGQRRVGVGPARPFLGKEYEPFWREEIIRRTA